jgi:hypothetical protein
MVDSENFPIIKAIGELIELIMSNGFDHVAELYMS